MPEKFLDALSRRELPAFVTHQAELRLLRRLHGAGYRLVVVTNEANIGRFKARHTGGSGAIQKPRSIFCMVNHDRNIQSGV